MGKSPYHVHNTQDFIHHIQNVNLEKGQCIIWYDVKALFTSVPIQPAISIITKLLEEDQELQQRTSLSVNNITCLLEFCLKCTYFTFQGRYFEQKGDAMGSPIIPIVAKLYMEDFEVKAINSSPQPPYLRKRFVDDTLPSLSQHRKQAFLEHLNSIDHHIQFTSEESRPDGSMPFLDILITPKKMEV